MDWEVSGKDLFFLFERQYQYHHTGLDQRSTQPSSNSSHQQTPRKDCKNGKQRDSFVDYIPKCQEFAAQHLPEPEVKNNMEQTA